MENLTTRQTIRNAVAIIRGAILTIDSYPANVLESDHNAFQEFKLTIDVLESGVTRLRRLTERLEQKSKSQRDNRRA